MSRSHIRAIQHHRGFTLIEAIMVIVITGVIAGIVSVFIKTSIDAYIDAERRAELTDAADVGLRRMMREVRLALPNSLRATTTGGFTYIEFIPTSTGGRYRDTGDGSTGGNVLDFVTATNKTFDVLGTSPANPPVISANDYIVVYNLGPGYSPADAYSGGNLTQVNLVTSGTPYSITLVTNVFAGESPPLPSPNSRFHVVPFATQAVTYACPTSTAGNVTRYWGYGFNPNQQTSPASFSSGSSAIVVGNATCDVEYLTGVMQRNAILYVRLDIKNTASNETISVFQQVHVDNSP